MAKLYITEIKRLDSARSGGGQVASLDDSTDQTPIDFTGGAVASVAFANGTVAVRVEADAVCSIAYGKTPVATTGNMRLAANAPEYFAVTPGNKISAIGNT